MKPISFSNGRGGDGEIWAELGWCDGCHERKVCLLMDQASGEYFPGAICKECAKKMFETGDNECS